MSTALSEELATYARLHASLMGIERGNHAVVNGDRLVGTRGSYGDALTLGYRECGLQRPFLVKRITQVDLPLTFTRDIFPARLG